MPSTSGRPMALVLALFLSFVAAPAAACNLAADAPPGQYAGECLNGLAHGRGTATSPAYTYEGEFYEGRRHGRGLLNVTGGHRYQGEFVHGKRHGHGVTILPDGGRHEGAWRDGEINGRGVLVFASGVRYEGEFRNSLFQGAGRTTSPSGETFEGQFHAGKRHGKGLLRRADGTVHDGEWKEGKMHGAGVLTTTAGAVATGTWQEDKFFNGTYTAADRSTVVFENGAVTRRSAAPVAAVANPAGACRESASNCETACAAGTLLGLLITQGKGDADKARADCQASCDSRKTDCLARADPPSGPKGPGGTQAPSAATGGRKYCSPRGHWCIHDPIAGAPPYRELKKACSFYYAEGYDPNLGHRMGSLVDFDEASLRKTMETAPPPGAPHLAYFRDRAEVAKCLLESGRSNFNKIGGEYFKANGYTFYVRRLPRSIWDESVRFTQEQHAKNMSTAWFDPGNAAFPRLEAYEQFNRKCGSIEVLGTFYPVAWWEENLKSLEAIAQRGTQWHRGESPILSELKKYRCHKAGGWPYAAEHQFWVQYLYEGRTR